MTPIGRYPLQESPACAQLDSQRHEKDFRYSLGKAAMHLQADLFAAAYAVLVLLVRLALLCLTLPLFAMAAFVGLVDDLVRRGRVRFCLTPG
ncbi:MAG: DUF4400 domain-containing protein [Paraburkholderia fungorum]|nr:DUF4400 domain-containing protein [Paraburkholderia fungorum]